MRGAAGGGTLLLAVAVFWAGLPGAGPVLGQASPSPGLEGEGPAVTLEELSWLQGTWRGEGPGGAVAEIHYMAPTAGGLPSIFRLWRGDELLVLELLSLVEEDRGLVMHIRHFSEELTPFEEDHPLTVRVVEGSPDRLYFENVRNENPKVSEMIRTGPDSFTSRSELHRPDGSVDTILVSYTRVPEGAPDSASSVGQEPGSGQLPDPEFSDARAEEGVLEWRALVAAPVADVWKAFTSEEGIESWMVPAAELDFRIGGTLRTNYDPEAGIGGPGTIVHRILSYEPERMLSMRTVEVPENAPQARAITESWGVIYMEPVGPDRTRVRLVSAGWGQGEAWDEALSFFRDANIWTLRQLQRELGGG